MIKVLLITDGIFHPPLLARKALHSALGELDGYEYTHVNSLEKLPEDLESYAAMVIYLHHNRISERALSQLDAFVSAGGGLLGIHTATASFKEQREYFEILGGRFVGHGPVKPFEVSPAGISDIFSGCSAFNVRDELYLHEVNPDINIHFSAQHEGQQTPVVWTYRYGQGRVCYCVPGHTTRTMRNENYQRVLKVGLMWVCGT